MFVIEASTPEEMAAALESGEADLAVTGVPLPGGPFDIRTLMLDPYVLAVSADHELAGRKRVPAAALDTLQLGALKHTSPEFDEYVGTYAGNRRVGFRSDDYPHLLGMVDAGITCALVTRLIVEPRAAGVKLVELDPPPPPRRIVLARHAARVPTRPMEELVKAAEQVGRELGGERAIRVA